MKILVADDNLGSLLVARAAVEALGHACLSAEDGARAWQTYQCERPDVILTDREMPDMDGVQLCRAVRAAEAAPAGAQSQGQGYTYLVLVTALGEPDDVLQGMAAGADDYITKPLEPFHLRTRLIAAQRVTALHAQLAQARVQLQRQATTDPLTGLGNRLRLTDDLDRLDAGSRRYGHPYCLAICDIDHFKAYNDTFGHPGGDQALRAVAGVLAGYLRPSDFAYRWGGEEFLVLLPEQDAAGGVAALDRLRGAVRDLAIPNPAGGSGVLTLSVGLTAWTAGRGLAVEQLVAEADAALYRAKAEGRDRVCCADAAVPTVRTTR